MFISIIVSKYLVRWVIPTHTQLRGVQRSEESILILNYNCNSFGLCVMAVMYYDVPTRYAETPNLFDRAQMEAVSRRRQDMTFE